MIYKVYNDGIKRKRNGRSNIKGKVLIFLIEKERIVRIVNNSLFIRRMRRV